METSKLFSRKFLLALATVVSHLFGAQLPMELVATVATYIAGESAIDFQRERRKAEVEKVSREGSND